MSIEYAYLCVVSLHNKNAAERSRALADFASLFASVPPESMAYLMSAWRGEVNLLELGKPEYKPFAQPAARRAHTLAPAHNPVVDPAIEVLA